MLETVINRANQRPKLKIRMFVLILIAGETVSPATAEKNKKIAVFSDAEGLKPNLIPHKVPLSANIKVSTKNSRAVKLTTLNLLQKE